MSIRTQLWFWFGIFASFVVGLWLLGGVLLPFIAGIVVAYFLDPTTDQIQRLGLGRTAATVTVTALFFLLVFGFLALLIPLIQGQLIALADRFPAYRAEAEQQITPLFEFIRTHMPLAVRERIREMIDVTSGDITKWAVNVIKSIISSSFVIANLLSLLLITPVVAFYLLRDWDRIIAKIDTWLPRDHAPIIRRLFAEMDRIMSGFIRGQLLVCFSLGLFYGVGLSIIDLDFGFLVGFATGLLSFIPYFGMSVGLVIGLAIALFQYSDWLPIVGVASVFAIGQILEGNFVTPKLVGDRVGLHPVWIIFALLAGGSLFGFVGILVAVPVAAATGVLIRFALARYMESKIYRGQTIIGDSSPSGTSEL
ncbi:MAG: AI-2E family transporter [Alphaproteobacteria bacterium]